MNEISRHERAELAMSRGIRTVPLRVAASWRRSTTYGISLDAVDPAFAGDIDTDSLFFQSGRRVLRDIGETLAGEPISLMLTDAEGLVLTRTCRDRVLLHALDDVHLAPGFDYSERETGTTGLGLALADRAPSLVTAEQHYCTRLWGYTCAAAPIIDPLTGELLGSVNLTTWSEQSHALLVALARSAASGTEALILARSRGRSPRPANPGRVVRVRSTAPGEEGPPPPLSAGWRSAANDAFDALSGGTVAAVVGEDGAGKCTLLGEVYRRLHPGGRILVARAPDPSGIEPWLSLWGPELGKQDTRVILSRVDRIPDWAAVEIARLVAASAVPDGRPPTFSMTSRTARDVPAALAELVTAAVEVPPLRQRRADILPLSRLFARGRRGRDVRFTHDAERVLAAFDWPGNAGQLRDVVRDAVSRADTVTVRDLPSELLQSGPGSGTRLEAIERDEITRLLGEPGASPVQVARKLGLSRATIYRRIARYDIPVPVRDPNGTHPEHCL